MLPQLPHAEPVAAAGRSSASSCSSPACARARWRDASRRPIERLTAAVRRFGEGDLPRASTPHARGAGVAAARHRHRADELEQLTRALNEMAERIEGLVRGQKELLGQRVARAALAAGAHSRGARAAAARRASNEARLRDVEADLVELDRLIEDVLTASRLEASGLPAHLGAVDVARCSRSSSRAPRTIR